MTREEREIIEAIKSMGYDRTAYPREKVSAVISMAIEALSILGESGIVNCCGCIHWKSDGGAMMVCDLWDTPMGDFDYCSFGKRGDTE